MEPRTRRTVRVTGRVQGVGFRPWAARLARSLELAGEVCNASDGVRIAIEGEPRALDAFLAALRDAPPPAAGVERIEVASEAPRGERGFAITASCDTGASRAPGRLRVPLDAPLCEACLAELFDPQARRYRYAFTHCASCGPRAAVLEALPYDRARTSLRRFPLCVACRHEYDDPADRRHHAEAIACPACGPALRAYRSDGSRVPGDPIESAVEILRAGGIVAMKGSGGFHLAADATNQDAVLRLRKRKERPAKPFALLVPDLAAAHRLVVLAHDDEALLASAERPVVVAARRAALGDAPRISDAVAPGIADLGVILPYAPLHWLLLFAPGATPARDRARLAPLVFSSANRSGEPTLHCGEAARRELATVADLFLDHDRAVVRPNDDAVHRSAAGGPIPIRLSRGGTPRVLRLPSGVCAREPIVAVGGDLKAAPAVVVGGEIVLAEHVGDLASASAADALVQRVLDLCRLLGVEPRVAVHDLHPDAVGAQLAARLAPRLLAVQHHHAHAAACLVEHGRSGPVLALALDGMGFGSDGTPWGGELLRVTLDRCERLAHLERVPLPGGDAAAREPWRMAAVWLARAFPMGAPDLPWHGRRDPRLLRSVLAIAERGVASPPTSSCGRLFDAIASLLDRVDVASYEGEAALALEALASEAPRAGPNERRAAPSPEPVIAIAPLVRDVVSGILAGTSRAVLARTFHEALAASLAAAAIAHARREGLDAVVLTGGCLQNRLLSESLGRQLEGAGLRALRHHLVPPGDGGLAVGQAAVAAAQLASPGESPGISLSIRHD